MRVSNMVNIGPKTTVMLEEIGIHDSDQLMKLGALETAAKLKEHFPTADINPLVFVGAIKGIRWRMIDALEQEQILSEYKSMATCSVSASL